MPFNPASWLNDSGKLFHGRSADLQRVDAALRQYELGKSAQTLKALARAILDWQQAKTPWIASIRATAMVELINYVKTQASTRFPEGDQEIFSYVKCEQIVHQLHSDPRQIMRHRPIYVSGQPDGVHDFRLQWMSGDPTYLYGPIVAPTLAPSPEKYSVATTNRGPVWRAISINMHTDVDNNSSLNDIEGKLYRLAGASSVTTGQLTGCTFIIRKDQGHVECTHIKPNGFGGDGVQLQTFIEGLGLGPDAVVYGRKDYPETTHKVGVAIIGRRGPHGWEIFAQRYAMNSSIVEGLDRIWPQ